MATDCGETLLHCFISCVVIFQCTCTNLYWKYHATADI